MEEKFDAIIVGGGPAGAVTALMLAREGMEVVVIDRGNYSGAKNMTGGRLYSHALEEVIPGFASKAPVERRVTRERVSMMTETGATTLDYSSEKLAQDGSDSYVVLRGVFDRWLMEQAEEAGAMSVTGIRVDDFIFRDDKVAGIIAGDEEMLADVVILADGANSLLVDKCGLRKNKITPHQMAVGAKEVIKLDEKTIEDRFNLNPGEGMCWLFAGSPSDGKIGGGLLYTNKDTISLGIVATLSEFEKEGKTIHEMLENFKQHPVIKPLIKDGMLVEYSGHMVPEGGIDMMPEMYSDNVLVTGDAASLVINVGYTVRGMDLAIGSAVCAAKAVIAAKEKGDYSKATLSKYKELLNKSFVIKDMQQVKKFPAFMEHTPRIFKEYPELAENAMADMFVVDGSIHDPETYKPLPLMKKMMAHVKKVGLFTLIKDGWRGIRAL